MNTALTKDENGTYTLLMEVFKPEDQVGKYPYTFFFAKSKDLVNWEFLDKEHSFSQDRYNGGPYMRYADGWYYVISVTELPCLRYSNYIYRTKDFKDWFVGYYNPILMPSEDDKIVSKMHMTFQKNLLKK